MSVIMPCTELGRLRILLGGIGTPMMNGDNISILLASHFENDEQDVNENGWTSDAIKGCVEVLDAIHAHYSDACASVQKERDELREMLGELRDLTMVEIGNGGSWSLEFDFGDGDENRDQMRQFADNLRAFLARYEGGR